MRVKQKAMKKVSSLPGVDSITMDMKDKKLTVTGDVDPVTVVSKLRKICHVDIVSVGPAKEPEKKEEDDKKKADGKKKEDDKKKAAAAYAQNQPYSFYPYQQQQPYYQYNHPLTQYDSKVVHDETPNCVIC